EAVAQAAAGGCEPVELRRGDWQVGSAANRWRCAEEQLRRHSRLRPIEETGVFRPPQSGGLVLRPGREQVDRDEAGRPAAAIWHRRDILLRLQTRAHIYRWGRLPGCPGHRPRVLDLRPENRPLGRPEAERKAVPGVER